MVQVLPPNVNIGTQIGQSLGAGLQQGMQQGVQRGLLQQALGKIRDISQQPNAKPLDTMLGLMEAGAGIPGSERYLATLLPMLLNQSRAENIFGGGSVGNQAGVTPQEMSAFGGGGTPFSQTAPKSNLGVGQTPAQEPKLGGFLPRIKTPEEIESFARNYAMQMGDPSRFSEGLQIANAQNNLAQNQNEQIRSRASELGVEPQELPEFMQLAQRYGHLKNPEELLTSANRDFQKYRNLKTKLDQALVPGLAKGALEKGLGLGLVGSLIAGRTSRDEMLKRLDPTIKELVDLGFEPMVRQKLASEHLSPTEVEERIHPLSKEAQMHLSSLQDGTKMAPEIQQKKLSKFFKDNVTPDTSLLVLRHKLWNDKGYNWEEVGPAIREAQTQGLKLTPSQVTEMTELETQPPRQSLVDIFSDWGRWMDYLRGNK